MVLHTFIIVFWQHRCKLATSIKVQKSKKEARMLVKILVYSCITTAYFVVVLILVLQVLVVC